MATTPRDGAPAPIGELGSSAPDTPRIWAIGGGKGGVGKSVVTSNLAAAMAGSGRRCAVIDLDLGGANLHCLLGVRRPRHSLSQLLTGDVGSIAELMVQTSVPNLWLVSGHQALLEMANPRPSDKEMLFRQIRELDVDDVVLDLGAGSNFTVLDFFLLARRGIVVVTPEPTSLENAEHFVRTAFYRSLHEVARRPDVASAVRRLRENGSPRRVRSAGELIALVRAIDPPAAKPLEDRARTFSPLLVVNKVGSPAQRSVGPQLVSTCRERHGVQLELAALLAADPNVSEAVFRGQTTLQAFPHSAFSRHIEALAERLLHGTQGEQFRERPVPRPRASAPVTRGAIPVRRAAADVAAPSRLPAIDPAEPGAHLRRCREALGLSLVEMTERTRIRILEQIEAERFDLLPPEPYLKGYLIEYARELGMAEIGLLVKSYLEKGARRASSPVEPAPPGGPQASAGGPQQEAQSLPRGLRLRRWRR